jgi:hypothetical protein
LRSAFNILAARIASATDIELLKTIFDWPCHDTLVSTMKTRSKTLPQINWDYCIFNRQKAIKKDRKLKRIESSERVKYILNAARGKCTICLTNKEDIVNAFLFSKRSWCKMSKNFLNAISCSDSFLIVE